MKGRGGWILWAIAAISIAVGIVTLASVGSVLILFGVLWAALVPLRDEPRVFWPLAAGLVVFIGGYLLTAPARCTQGAVSQVGGDQVETRFCESLAGIEYRRTGTEDPSQLPPFVASLAAGLALAGGARLVLRRKERLVE